ncbi:hypothetical protein BJ170DRAFT_352241 [Xylariales sp. AK1849]|nr:hypothetical protein BJ170DRAFT_352241 [Xylariales sp. AK1849]
MADSTDPWDWDTDRVVQELCTENRSWVSASIPPKLPDLSRLEASLRENEVDGDALLGEASSEIDFFSDLGVKSIKHKQTLRSAIAQFRRRSNGYKLFKSRQDQEDEVDYNDQSKKLDDDESRQKKLDDHRKVEELDDDIRKRRLEDERNPEDDNTPFDTPQAILSDPSTPAAAQEAVTLAASMPQSPRIPTASGSPAVIDAATTADVAPAAEPARKKRRIAPVTLSADVDIGGIRNIPQTQADVVMERLGLIHVVVPESEGYLGNHAWTRVDLMDFDFSAQPLTAQDQEFSFDRRGQSKPPPHGRRRQVGRLFKRRLANLDPLYKPAKADLVPGGNDPDHDEVLPLMGDSDSDEEYDSDTWKEIQIELKERKESAQGQALTVDEKNSAIDDIIAECRSSWETRKLPKLERSARSTWNMARRHGLKQAIDRQKRELQRLEDRLTMLRAKILEQEWVNTTDIRKTAGNLDLTVEECQRLSWMLALLKSPIEPKKLPLATGKVSQRQERPVAQLGEDICTSESDDDFVDDDFVIDDEVESRDEVMMDAGEEVSVEHVESLISDPATGDMVPEAGETPAQYTDPIVEEASAPVLQSLHRDELSGDEPGSHESDDNEGQSGDRGEAPQVNTPVTVSSKGNDRVDDVPMEGPENTFMTDAEEILDLTQVESPEKPIASSTPRRPKVPEIVDLVTPEKGDQASTQQRFRTPATGRSVLKAIQLSPDLLRSLTKNQQTVLQMLNQLDKTYRSPIFHFATRCEVNDLWRDFVVPGLDADLVPQIPLRSQKERDIHVALVILKLFDAFTEGEVRSFHYFVRLSKADKQAIRDKEEKFTEFVSFINRLSQLYVSTMASTRKHSSTPVDSAITGEMDKEPRNPTADLDEELNQEYDDDSPSKKRKPTIIRDRAAQNLRESDQRRVQQQAERRKITRANMAITGGSTASQKSHLIINESKEDDQGFIYVNDSIAKFIKPHQIRGVTFMWNQIVMDAQVRQGCLLAHTMGLGKTMQIITLLVAISEAAASDDPTISSQIPDDLKKSRTLVLAPPGLVNNWVDEILMWTQWGHRLGDFFKIDADDTHTERCGIIQDWVDQGGVLIMGYDLFKKFIDHTEVWEDLLEKPNIVIADEAHMMKNPKSKVHQATAGFRTHSRIALTGSPLANNVLEYHSMISWIAPNYLSDLREFRQDYATPIEAGLSVDSTAYERRKALTKLRVLKETVAPKVHRRTIAALKDELPPKIEFVISVPLTDMQRKAYEMYMNNRYSDGTANTARLFASLQVLGLLCNHPACFRQRLMQEKNKAANAVDELTGNAALPPQLVSDALQCIPHSSIQSKDAEQHSRKIPLLNKILDESKKVGDRVLIFSQSIATLDYLEKILRRHQRHIVRLDGRTKMNLRQGMVKDFNKGRFDIFLISTTAGGLGLNITGANRVIIFDFKFNPQHEQQAVGRAYRLGQTKPVFVYRFICAGTFEEKLQNKGVFKMQLASRVVDKKNPIPKAQRFEELFAMPGNPPKQDLKPLLGKDRVLDNILNSELESSICSIVMADTFEEENLEDEVLTKEEQDEAQRLIQMHQARLTGQPLNLAFGVQMPNGEIRQVLPTAAAAAAASSSQWAGQANVTLSNSLGVTDTQADFVYCPSMAPTIPVLQGGSQPSFQSGTLQPVLSASTQLRSPAQTNVGLPHSELHYWNDDLQAFRGELRRLFSAGESVEVMKQNKRQAAEEVAHAFSEQRDRGNQEVLGPAMWAIIDAAKSQRFIEAILIGRLSPSHLATLSNEEINTARAHLDSLSEQDWTNEVNIPRKSAHWIPTHWNPGNQKSTNGPEPAAQLELQPKDPMQLDITDHPAGRPKHVPDVQMTDNPASQPAGQSEDQPPGQPEKPRSPASERPRLGQRRSHRDDDQAALREYNARRDAKKKEQRSLPNWAQAAVRSQGRSTPSSSASPGPSSMTAPRKARNPFS